MELNLTKYVSIILLFCCQICCLANEITLEKVKKFLPKSAISSETRLYVGDLNRDGIKDALLRFKVINEPLENEHFYILLEKKDGTITIYNKDIFYFDNKDGMIFDTVTISKDSDFTVKYKR